MLHSVVIVLCCKEVRLWEVYLKNCDMETFTRTRSVLKRPLKLNSLWRILQTITTICWQHHLRTSKNRFFRSSMIGRANGYKQTWNIRVWILAWNVVRHRGYLPVIQRIKTIPPTPLWCKRYILFTLSRWRCKAKILFKVLFLKLFTWNAFASPKGKMYSLFLRPFNPRGIK